MCSGDIKWLPDLPSGKELNPTKKEHHRYVRDFSLDPANLRSVAKAPEPLPAPETPKALEPVKFAKRRTFSPERTAAAHQVRRTSILTG